LYDINEDGYIQPDEMVNYLSSVFKVLYETSPDIRQQMGVSPLQLAVATTKQCFETCDVNHDGKLSLDEFKVWYKNPGQTSLNQMLSHPIITIDEARKLTCLDCQSSENLFELFAESADENGLISRRAFNSCFQYLMSSNPAGAAYSIANKERAKLVIDLLFDIFDEDKNGYVDYSELASGLSVLAAGTRDEKVQAAFELYDSNGDGVISLEEMVRYFTAVFRVLYGLDQTKQGSLGISPEDLALVTAKQAFQEADTNRDGKLNFEEFQR